MARHVETVIIGAGIAGLACARRLQDRRRPFLLITENVGGRIRAAADGASNLGAYYVRSDYTHVNQFVDRGRPITRRRLLRGAEDGTFTRSDLPLLLHLPQTLRFVRLLHSFGRRYETFKQNCVVMSQAEAITGDPWLLELYHEPAGEFIERHQVEDLCRLYVAPGVRGTAFTSVDRLTAFTLLVGALNFVRPIFEYSFRFDVLTAGFADDVLLESVTDVASTGTSHSIQTRQGTRLTADNVVVATPIDVAAQWFDLGPVKSPISAHIFLVIGQLRRPWSASLISFFPPGDQILALALQAGGSTVVSSVSETPDFARLFDTWEVVERCHWNPAFQLVGDALLECEQKPGVYLVGDHNVCNLEDAFITGLHAAHRILAGSLERPGREG